RPHLRRGIAQPHRRDVAGDDVDGAVPARTDGVLQQDASRSKRELGPMPRNTALPQAALEALDHRARVHVPPDSPRRARRGPHVSWSRSAARTIASVPGSTFSEKRPAAVASTQLMPFGAGRTHTSPVTLQ